MNQYRFQKLYDEKSIEMISKHSMDDCSRGEKEFYNPLSSSHKAREEGEKK